MDKDIQSHDIDARARLNAVLNTSIYAIVCINSRGIIDLFNLAAEKMFGYSADEVIGKNINVLMPEPYATEHDQYIARYETTGEKKIIGTMREIIAKHKSGEVFPIELEVNETKINGQSMYTGFIRDLRRKARSELQAEQFQNYLKQIVEARTRDLTEANKKLEELVRIDGLTNIANRRCFDEVLENEIRRTYRNNSAISLIMCDIDHFKQYNDHYGHVGGDQCLQKVAACFKETFKRSTDLPARYGGEEFAVILPETPLEGARVVAGKLGQRLDDLQLPHANSNTADHVTLSIGIAAAIPTQGFTGRELIKMADKALYEAKAKGRNRIEVINCNS
ncbi:MAG: two-component response regulator [Gammaproteobacteria bacterium]|nr:two-component response regulator [Gammaproteobacteria bacterium]